MYCSISFTASVFNLKIAYSTSSTTRKHNLIAMADKVKWIYLKDNPYKIEALAFLDYDMPDKIKDFLDLYADRKKVFESILLNKLEGFFSDLGWNLNLNPHIRALDSFEI